MANVFDMANAANRAKMPPKAPTPIAQAPTAPFASSQSTSPGTPTALSSYAPGVNLTSTNPANDLRGQTITPGPMADRKALAGDYLSAWDKASTPYFQRDLRTATSNAAGKGQIGSGQLRGALGDVTTAHDTQREAAAQQFYTSALDNSVNDAYRNIGVAQQQQGFQAGLQNQTFNQGLQSLYAGNYGNPADAYGLLSNTYSNSANSGNAALNGLIASIIANQGKTATNTPTSTPQTQLPVYGGAAPVYG